MRFQYSGKGDDRSCLALAQDLRSGTELQGNPVSVKMAKDYGWWGRSGSQWPKNTDQLLAYRAAGWFGRLHCPEVLLGVATREEIVDAVIDVEPEVLPPAPAEVTEVLPAAPAEAVTVEEPAVAEEPQAEPEPTEPEPEPTTNPTSSGHRDAALRGIPKLTTTTALEGARRRCDTLLQDGHLTPDDAAQVIESVETRLKEIAS